MSTESSSIEYTSIFAVLIVALVSFLVFVDYAYGVPIERVPASSLGIVDLEGNRVAYPSIYHQYIINSEFGNAQDKPQKFVVIGQIQNEEKKTIKLAWIQGILNSYEHSSANFSWIPQEAGKYRVTIYVWESLTNFTSLSPVSEMDFEVKGKTYM